MTQKYTKSETILKTIIIIIILIIIENYLLQNINVHKIHTDNFNKRQFYYWLCH